MELCSSTSLNHIFLHIKKKNHTQPAVCQQEISKERAEGGICAMCNSTAVGVGQTESGVIEVTNLFEYRI